MMASEIMYFSKIGVVGLMCQLWHFDGVVLHYASSDTVLQIVIGSNRISGHWCSLYWFSPIGFFMGSVFAGSVEVVSLSIFCVKVVVQGISVLRRKAVVF